MNQKWQYQLSTDIGGTLISALGDQVALVGVVMGVAASHRLIRRHG